MCQDRLIWPSAVVRRKLPGKFSGFSLDRTLSLSDFTTFSTIEHPLIPYIAHSLPKLVLAS